MKRIGLFAVVALAIAPAASLHATPLGTSVPDSIAFTLERPDTAGNVGLGSSIRIDSSGHAHIAYGGGVPGASGVRYARKSGSGWSLELIPGTINAGPLDLALDGADQPWIPYVVSSPILSGDHLGPLKVAHKAGDTWVVETLDLRASYEIRGAAAFDPSGALHVAFAREAFPATIVYATRGPTGWSFETVAQEFYGVNDLSLAFDREGRVHAVWCSFTNTTHAVRTSDGWTREFLPGADALSLAMDPEGRPCLITMVGYYGSPPLTRYFVLENGVWNAEVLDPEVLSGGGNLSLQIDRYGRPFIAFTGSGRTLSLAWKDGGSWNSQVVDAVARSQNPSLALAGGTSPRISYFELASQGVITEDLGYASGESPALHEPLAARAFLVGASRTVPLVPGGRNDLCVQLEPVGSDYVNVDVETESVVMLSESTGTTSEIRSVSAKTIASGDQDGNGVEELRFCFSGIDLATLFSSIVGRVQVEVTVEATLRSGARIRAPLKLTIVPARRGRIARVYPNPLNPTGTLGFVVTRRGPLRVEVFDTSGRLVRVLVDEWVDAPGYREVPIAAAGEGRSLTSGVYFYRAESAGERFAGRFVVLK